MISTLSPLRAAFGLAAALALGACGTTSTVSRSAPTEYVGPTTVSGPPLIQQMRTAAPSTNPGAVFMIGKCGDGTGRHLDAEMMRYSRAVTQDPASLVANYLINAGFNVVPRDPYDMGLLAQEYSLSHQFDPNGRNIGLIQHNAPSGGLTAANYMVTCSIPTYSSSVNTGGGGADVDSLGFSTRTSEAVVGVVVTIYDVSTGLAMSSLHVESTVVGTSMNFHVTRIIGDVVSTVATVAGGGASTTVTRPLSDLNIASAEFGGARQMPIDYAVIDSLVVALARQLEANPAVFYTRAQGPIRFDYDVSSTN